MNFNNRMSQKRSFVQSVFYGSLFLIIFSLGIFPETPEILTISESIELTLKNNQDLFKYANNVLSMKSNLDQKKKNFLPDLSLSGNFSKNYYKTADDSGDYLSNNNRNFNLSLSTNLVLFNGFFNVSDKARAFSRYKGSRNNYTRTEQTVIFQTILNYLDVVLSKELIRVGNENLNTQNLLLARIKDFFKAGKKAAVDVHYQNAEIANSQYQLLNSEKGLKLAKVKLMEGIGFVSGLEFDVVIPVIDDPANFIDLEKAEILKLAKGNRADLKAAELSIDAAKYGLTSAKSGYYPKISLFGDVSSGYSSRDIINSFSDQLWDNNLSASVGVAVSMQIFDRGSTRNQVTQARLDLENSRIDLIKVENQVWSELIQAESNYRTALRLIEVAGAKLEYSMSALDSMTERYNVNAATITEVSQTRSQYLQSQYDQVDAKMNLFRQGITLLYQIGDTKKMLSLIR